MTTINIKLGVPTAESSFLLIPGVNITINGDHALAVEILKYLKEFTSPVGQIEVK